MPDTNQVQLASRFAAIYHTDEEYDAYAILDHLACVGLSLEPGADSDPELLKLFANDLSADGWFADWAFVGELLNRAGARLTEQPDAQIAYQFGIREEAERR